MNEEMFSLLRGFCYRKMRLRGEKRHPIPGIHFHKRRRHTHPPGHVQQAPQSVIRGTGISEKLPSAYTAPLFRLDAPARGRGQEHGRRPRRSRRHVVFGAHLLPPADAAQAGRRQAYGRMPDSDTKRGADGFVKKTHSSLLIENHAFS